jgi:osmotically-inducible protein OsmY
LPQARISSSVSNGWVILDGQLGSAYEREAAEQDVSNLTGVRGVIDRVEVD